jgi:hypothetical protein
MARAPLPGMPRHLDIMVAAAHRRRPRLHAKGPVIVTADGWTIPMACEQFERQGMPVEERHLRAIIRHLPGFNPVGETKSGPTGGRGHPLYEIGALQRLHAALSPWLSQGGDAL